MIIKKKICIECQELEYIFSRKMCKKCSVKNPKPKSKLKEPIKKPLYKPTGELALFQSIWETKPHVCTVCNEKLHTFNVGFFSHILSKGAFPKFRLFAENIVVKCLNCHHLYETKTNKDLLNINYQQWFPIINLHDKLIEKYYHEDRPISIERSTDSSL